VLSLRIPGGDRAEYAGSLKYQIPHLLFCLALEISVINDFAADSLVTSMSPTPHFHSLFAIVSLTIAPLASADVSIAAKAVKTSSSKTEEIWAIRIDLENTGSTPLGPLVIQYRRSGFSEFEEDGRPTTGKLEHTDGTIKPVIAVIAPGQKASVDSPGMNFVGDADNRKLAKGMIQSIRVRAWQNGKLVGEFSEKGGKAADVEWPLNPPPVPEGAEVGSGPWLLIADGRADFSGLALGASAAEVLKMLKTHGPGKIDAKPEPLHGHPLRMNSADLPGVTFGFDAAKKLSAIEITDPSRAKLPGGLVLGKSTLADFEKSLGPSEPANPVPAGVSSASRFKLGNSNLTIRDQADTPNTAAILLE